MTLSDYLNETFVQNALIAATLVAVTTGLIGPFVIIRDLAFAVHGSAELAFTGAAAGLLAADDPVLGALLGSLVVATAIGLLGDRPRERNSAIGVILAFGLGLGVFLLSLYKGFATAATNILFGQIFGVSPGQINLLIIIAIAVLATMLLLYRPLLFDSIDHDVALARGVPTRLVGLVFVYLLALTVTEAAQIVGTLLVLSLAITPAAAATRLTARTPVLIGLSITFCLIAADGGLLLGLIYSDVKASVFISTISFAIYAVTRLATTGPPQFFTGRAAAKLRKTGFRGLRTSSWPAAATVSENGSISPRTPKRRNGTVQREPIPALNSNGTSFKL